MRVKPVPPPPADLATVRAAQRSVPLVPSSEADCCGRLMAAMGLPSRDRARTWLTFLRGLGLVREGAVGFVRRRVEPDREAVAAGLRDGVFGARELLAALATGPIDEATAFETLADHVPPWERARDPSWRETWRTRVGYLLDWLVLAGLARCADGEYVRA